MIVQGPYSFPFLLEANIYHLKLQDAVKCYVIIKKLKYLYKSNFLAIPDR